MSAPPAVTFVSPYPFLFPFAPPRLFLFSLLNLSRVPHHFFCPSFRVPPLLLSVFFQFGNPFVRACSLGVSVHGFLVLGFLFCPLPAFLLFSLSFGRVFFFFLSIPNFGGQDCSCSLLFCFVFCSLRVCHVFPLVPLILVFCLCRSGFIKVLPMAFPVCPPSGLLASFAF